jgi:hypothetical protein
MLTFSKRYLEMKRAAHRGTGGTTAENRHLGFAPAFMDSSTGRVYQCTFADGRPAPFHVLDGLPDALVIARDRRGRPSRVLNHSALCAQTHGSCQGIASNVHHCSRYGAHRFLTVTWKESS